MKSPANFLTKTALLMVFYTFFFVVMSLVIVFNMIRAKMTYREMNLKVTVWVFFVFAFIFKIIGACGNKYINKVQPLLYVLDVIFSSIAFLGLYWHFEMINADKYVYEGHFVVICGVTFFSTAVGFLFSTFIRMKKVVYSIPAGVVLMTISNIICLALVNGMWTVHDVKFYKLFAIWFWYLVLAIYIALNAKFMLERRAKTLNENDVVHAFFAFNIDWCSYFWVDLFQSAMAKKKKKNKKTKKPKSESSSNSVQMDKVSN